MYMLSIEDVQKHTKKTFLPKKVFCLNALLMVIKAKIRNEIEMVRFNILPITKVNYIHKEFSIDVLRKKSLKLFVEHPDQNIQDQRILIPL